MSLPLESIEVGRCYITDGGQVRRVLEVLPDGRVQYEMRRGPVREGHPWPRQKTTTLAAFAANLDRAVPCDWQRGGTPPRVSSVSIEVGACYLSKDGRIRKVMGFLPDGRVRYQYRGPLSGRWRSVAQERELFAAMIERPVPCDWTQETE